MATLQAAVGISLILVILTTEAVVGLTPLTTYTKDTNLKSYSTAIQICATSGGRLLAIDSEWKYNILDHLGLFDDTSLVSEGMWMDVVYDSNNETACNEDLFFWRNCSSVGSTVPWDQQQPLNCLENKCTIFSNQKWKTERCGKSRKLVCEKISGDCTFAERDLTLEHTNFITYSLPNPNALECESLCRTTEIYTGRTEECWLYIVDEGTCFLYFGSQEMSINVTTNSGGSQTHRSQRRVFKVKTCARLVEAFTPVSADIESYSRSQCQTTDGEPGNPVTVALPICTFMEASLSALEKEMENNNIFHMVLNNSSMDVCLTRCLTSTVERLECQAVLIVTYSSDCSLYYGSNRFTFDQSSSPIPDIKVHFRRCRNDPTTTTRTTTTTPTTTPTTTTTPTITQAPTIKDDETRTNEDDISVITSSTLRPTPTPLKTRPKDEFNLTVPKTTLSSFRNKYISVYESRPSAVSMGVLGGLLIVVLVALVVVSDVKVIWVHVTTIGLRNIRMGFSTKVANKDKSKVEDDNAVA